MVWITKKYAKLKGVLVCMRLIFISDGVSRKRLLGNKREQLTLGSGTS